MLDRLLLWFLGHQNPNDTSMCVSCDYHNWHFFNALTRFPELTKSFIRDSILAHSSSPSFHADSFALIAHLYMTDFRAITTECPSLFDALRQDIALLRGLIADGDKG
jgi:hypothetical protein